LGANLFGYVWETRSVGASMRGPLTEYTSDLVGTFSFTRGAARELGEIDDYKVLAAIHHTFSSGVVAGGIFPQLADEVFPVPA
jgi:hypothetical protein